MRRTTAAAPIAMPMISPVDRAGRESDPAAAVAVALDVGVNICELVGVLEKMEVDVGREVEDEIEESCSDGKPSPGLKASVEFFAKAC